MESYTMITFTGMLRYMLCLVICILRYKVVLAVILKVYINTNYELLSYTLLNC